MASQLPPFEKMAERTPLITAVRISAPRQRYHHNTTRRFCTIALFSSLTTLVVLFLLPAALLPPVGQRPLRPPPPPDHGGDSISYKELQQILIETPHAEKAMEWSKYYTSGPHLAGKNLSQAVWTQDLWQEFGVKSDIVAYDTYINYPLGHRLALYEKTEKTKGEKNDSSVWKVKFEAGLEEDVLEDDPTSSLENRIPTFHGYSATGNVTAGYVYVNYGTYQDFEDLLKANISLEGKIAISKYGGIFRGLKVKRAQELGMIGIVIFTDPGDDGGVTEEAGFKMYPDGPARNPSSVQRGSTQFLSIAPGDPYACQFTIENH